MLSSRSKIKLIEAAHSVYWAYLSLEFANEPMKAKEPSFATQINQALQSRPFKTEVTLGGSVYSIEIKQASLESKEAPELYEINFLSDLPHSKNKKPKITHLKAYTVQQKQQIIRCRPFTAQYNPITKQYVLGTKIEQFGKVIPIGGPDKLRLYASHIANLGIFIEKLQKSTQSSAAMLAALATGAGKSFTQALWILILYIADLKGLFAAPKHLVLQLKADIERLLPEQVTQHIASIQSNQNELKAAEPPLEKPFGILSYETLCSNEFSATMRNSFPPELTLLSLDEQHLTNQRENWTIKLRNFAKEYLSVILTATPKKNTYQLSGNKTTVSMSRKQKEKAGLAIPSANKEIRAITFKEKINASNENWFIRNMNKLIASFANALVAELSSPVDEMIRQSKYSFVAKPKIDKNQSLEHFLRWNIATPASEKMLIITHDHDTLINLIRGLNDEDTAQSIYHNGTLVQRTCIYDLFEIYNVENRIINEFENTRKAAFKDELKALLKKSGFKTALTDQYLEKITAPTSMKQQAKRIIFTNVLNTALRLITKYDNKNLDQMRHDDLDALHEKVSNAARTFNTSSETLTEQFKEEGLDAQTAEKLANNVLIIINFLKNAHPLRKQVIDNWIVNADENIMAIFHATGFNWETHYTRFSFEGLEKNLEEAIQDNVVYNGFQQATHSLKNEDGSFNSLNKKRPHNAIEIFNDKMKEYAYSPSPDLNMNTEQMKAAFKKGLIPFLIGNTMVEGFNDPDLNVTLNLISKTTDPSNQPDKAIQAAGRNRCLNPYRIPMFLQFINAGVKSVFSLKSLDKMDYVPDFLKSTKKYNQLSLDAQGKKMAQKIREWTYEQLESHGHIDTDAINAYIFQIAKEAILELNKNNDHDIEQSRKQFVSVLDSLNQELEGIRYKIRHTYELSSFVNFIGNLLNAIGQLVYRSYRKKAYAELTERVENAETYYDPACVPKIKLYHKIVGKDFALIQKNAMVFLMLGDTLKDKALKIQTEAENKKEILIDKHKLIDSINKNIIEALKKAKSLKNKSDASKHEQFNARCEAMIKSIRAQDKALLVELMTLDQGEEKADGVIGLPVSVEKTLKLVENNQELGILYRQLDNEDRQLLDRCLKDKVEDNSVLSDTEAFLNISQCHHYKTLSDLVHSPIFLRLVQNSLSDFNDLELQYFLSKSDDDINTDALQDRVIRIRILMDDLTLLSQDDFDEKYIKYIRDMKQSKQILEDISIIFKTQFESHLYFHRINKKGLLDPNQTLPLLFRTNRLDKDLDLDNYRVISNQEKRLSAKATQLFFLKAIKDSLPDINAINEIIQREQDAHLVHVGKNLVTPLRAEMNRTWKWTLFGKPKNDSQAAAKRFGEQVNQAKPLTMETAIHQEHCLSNLSV